MSKFKFAHCLKRQVPGCGINGIPARPQEDVRAIEMMHTSEHRLSQMYPGEMQEFDGLLAEFEDLIPKQVLEKVGPNSEAARHIDRVRERLRQSRREFDALLFFAVFFGMLKSGKSTLVSLLAGHPEASPSQFGLDTTLRPCLVLAGKQDEINVFLMKDSMKSDDSGEAERKCFNAVIDHLRGVIESEEELATIHNVVARKVPFTKDNIIKALCSAEGFGSEPLITVVRLEKTSPLLRSGIALLDVPGLDSDKMGTAVARYVELLERCDLLLFIQSTISALNHDGASMLKKLVERSKNSPVWLIQNVFEAQGWRDPEDVARQESKLTQAAREQLGKALAINPGRIFTKQVNLGKAYDARFENEKLCTGISADALQEESGFSDVERDLSLKINEERVDIQLANCLNQLNDAVEKNRITLAGLEKWISDESARLFSFTADLDGLAMRFASKGNLIPALATVDENGSTVSPIKQVLETYRAKWKARIVAGLDQWKSSIRDRMIGDEFNRELDRRIAALFDEGIEKIFSLEGAFGTDLADIFRLVAEKSSAFRELRGESQETMARHECELLDADYPSWTPAATVRYLDTRVVRPGKVNGGRHWYGAKKTVEVDTCREKIDEAAANLQFAADQYANGLQAAISEDFHQYRDDQLAVFFIKQIRSRKEKKTKEAQDAKKDLERLQQAIAPLRGALGRLRRFADAFRMKHNLSK